MVAFLSKISNISKRPGAFIGSIKYIDFINHVSHKLACLRTRMGHGKADKGVDGLNKFIPFSVGSVIQVVRGVRLGCERPAEECIMQRRMSEAKSDF